MCGTACPDSVVEEGTTRCLSLRSLRLAALEAEPSTAGTSSCTVRLVVIFQHVVQLDSSDDKRRMNEQKQWTSSMTRRGVVYLGRGSSSHKVATVRAPTFQCTILTFHH